MKATVIIPIYKDWPRLQLCLDALAAQTLPAPDFQVLVANNNCSPDLPPDLRLAANVQVIWAEQPGSYAARNAVLPHATGDILFFTDCDCIPDRDWLLIGVDHLTALPPDDRIAGGITLFPAGEDWLPEEVYDRLLWLKQADYARSGWGTTANLVLRRSLIERVGLFDANLLSGGDKEWNKRANAIGSKVHYDPQVMVNHPARGSFAELVLKRRRLTGGKHKQQAGSFKRFVPPVGLLVPSLKMMIRLMRNPDLPLSTRLALLRIDYALRLVSFAELMRLRYRGSASVR